MHQHDLATRLSTGPDTLISARVLRPLLELAAQTGVPRASLQKSMPWAFTALGLDGRVALTELYRLLDVIVDLTGDPAFGLHCVERLTSRAFNPVADLVYHSSDLRHSFASFAKFASLLVLQA